ncbi:odorant receptor 46a-like [Odontomachus brunneus]|uniref:odorant receptor 46a-like n=1 Tax=Odontomachus brunneus TaxID=486640 RepID=UPI0013F1D941|nr:odorant receptor 46a-like [Odontomachus brunneus]
MLKRYRYVRRQKRFQNTDLKVLLARSCVLHRIILFGVYYRYAKTVNSIFNEVLFVQFFCSILVLCTSVYYMSKHITDSEVIGITVYTSCMFVQIFIYCWSGNEVMLKSMNLADAVYHVDWSSLSISERKDLLMIMRRSAVPIKFTSFLITLSLQSYGKILKTSYSAFSVLQQS